MTPLRDQDQFAAGSSQLLMALAEQLKLPYMQIARRSELMRTSLVDVPAQLREIELTADTALQLIDNYLIGMQLSSGQLALVLEPVSVASVLHETAHKLSAYAKQYHIELELKMTGRFAPVMAHRSALISALCSIGQVFIESRGQQAGSQVVTLAAHRTNHGGITAGVFGSGDELTTDMFRRARQLYGRARQPLFGVTAATGAGIFVADSIFNALSTKLRVARHGNLAGLAASMQPSRQLLLL